MWTRLPYTVRVQIAQGVLFAAIGFLMGVALLCR